MAHPRVLLIEDDGRLRALYAELLEAEGFEVHAVASLADAARALETEPPEVLLLDLGLPDGDGLDWLVWLRARWWGPVLIITARGDTADEIAGLDRGADDYLAKPVRAERLVARVRALSRRHSPTRRSRLVVGDLIIDATSREVHRGGELITLTTAEFELLWYLANHAGTVVAREALYRSLRGIPWDGVDRSIDLRVSRLRKLISDDSKQPTVLKTVRGVGYLLVAS